MSGRAFFRIITNMPSGSDQPLAIASAALQNGDPLAALTALGVRSDCHARAIRGIALAQLGEFERAKKELTEARAEFVRRNETKWAAKALAALAEICFATRDLALALDHLDAKPLRDAGDFASAAYIDIQKARLYALFGRTKEARVLLNAADGGPAAALARAELAAASGCFVKALEHAINAGASINPLLAGEGKRLAEELRRKAFTLRRSGVEQRIALIDIETVADPYVDTIRRRCGNVDLRLRAGQLELLVALARGPVTAKSLFGRVSESLQVRLRMEVSRLRKASQMRIEAAESGYVCAGLGLLTPDVDDPLALLADGEAWSPRALAAVLGESVRTLERRLRDYPDVIVKGQGKARRYLTSRGAAATATRLLLLARPELG